VAIVGTRLPSAYGKFVAEKFSRELSEKGIMITSGLARGIDTVAHSSSLKAGGRTIAVIGSSIDMIYPSENKKLAGRIEESGAVVSNFYGDKTRPRNVPAAQPDHQRHVARYTHRRNR